MERAIEEINSLGADVVACTGDLTGAGFQGEFEAARAYLDRFEAPELIVIPGNHDSRNVGYVHFEELFGPRKRVVHLERPGGRRVSFVSVDSTEPDQNHGRIGRGRYGWILDAFAPPADLRVFMLHHHLLPLPGTGRERSTVDDAGDALEVLQMAGVNLVLGGHKHVPYVWRLEDMFIVHAGTVSTLRLRGHVPPSYNVVRMYDSRVEIDRHEPGGAGERILEFSLTDRTSWRKRTGLIIEQLRAPSEP